MISTISFVITCVTAVISFVTLTVKLTRYITKAEAKIDHVANEEKEFEKRAEGEHKEMWTAVDKNTKEIQRHDIWIEKHKTKHELMEGDDCK